MGRSPLAPPPRSRRRGSGREAARSRVLPRETVQQRRRTAGLRQRAAGLRRRAPRPALLAPTAPRAGPDGPLLPERPAEGACTRCVTRIGRRGTSVLFHRPPQCRRGEAYCRLVAGSICGSGPERARGTESCARQDWECQWRSSRVCKNGCLLIAFFSRTTLKISVTISTQEYNALTESPRRCLPSQFNRSSSAAPQVKVFTS